MDRFASGMIARGPTLAADRATWTGSLHIVDLPSAEAAHRFVEHEPYNRAGLFEEHFIRRFDNLLGRTMWESSGSSDDPRFLVIAHVPAESAVRLPDFADLAPDRLIVHGELRTVEDSRPVGIALALQEPTREAVDALLRSRDPGFDQQLDVRILDWEFGGRR